MRGLRGRKFGNGNMLTADVPNTTNRELFAKKPGSGSEENSMPGMHAINQIIAEEAGPYRQILKDEGIGGLLRAVQ